VGYTELRELYDRARLVAVPLVDVDYAAGHNAVLEAFCMRKALVVSGSRGMADYIHHMRDAYVIPPGNAEAMTEALTAVHSDAALRENLRSEAASSVRDGLNLDTYVRALAGELSKVTGAPSGR
jgi:glycosyltransferase involved in cell wall biosynthesis